MTEPSRFPRARRLVDRWNDWVAAHPVVEVALLVLVPFATVSAVAYALGDDPVEAALRGVAFGVTYAALTVLVRRRSASG